MTLDELIREGNIHPFQASRDEINGAMEIARRDLATAEAILGHNLDWSFVIAYNAVLQACRAYMFQRGYRPAAAEAHKATFAFMQIMVPESYRESVAYFDRVRKKRHRTLYDMAGLISEKEAKELLKKAREFLIYVEAELGSG